MRLFKKGIGLILGLTLATGLLTGCGASDSARSNGSYAASAYKESSAMDDFAYEVAEEAGDYDGSTAGGESVEVNDTSRKLIKTVNIDAETNDLTAFVSKINARVDALGGYVESSNIYNGSDYDYDRKNASFTIRIPSKNLSEFVNNVTGYSNVISKNEDVTDITLSYVDLEAKRDSLKTQNDRLLELMENAETVEDIMSIEERLSEIRYELDSAERQIRSYDNQVDYSTVYLSVSEVKQYTPVAEQTRLERMTQGFLDSIENVGEGLLDFGVNFVIAIPYLIVWAIVITIIVLIIRGIVKGSKKRKEKKMLKLQQKYQAQQQASQSSVPSGNVTVQNTEVRSDGK